MTHKYTTELSNSYSFNNLQRVSLPAFTVSRKRGSSQSMPTSPLPPVGYHYYKPGHMLIHFRHYVKLDHKSEPWFYLWFVLKNPGFIPRLGGQLFRLSSLIILTFFTCIRHRLFVWIPAGKIFIFLKMAIRALGPTQQLIQWRAEFIALVVKLSRSEVEHSPSSSLEVEWMQRQADVSLWLHGLQGNNFTFSRFDSECSWFSLVFLSMLCDVTLRQTTTTSCYILSNSWPSTFSKLRGLLY